MKELLSFVRRMRMSAVLMVAVLAVTGVIAFNERNEPIRITAVVARWRADSAAYEAQIGGWLRDSAPSAPVVLQGTTPKRDGARPAPPRRPTDYEIALAKYLRDSLVLDSIASSIDTDSLARLWTRMLRAKRPVDLLNDLFCETDRLRRQYGVPAEIAAKRTRDSAYADNLFAAVRMHHRRLPEQFEFSEACTIAPRGADTVSGTSVRDDLMPRPRPRRLAW